MKDAIGKILKAGDLIAYPVRQGSHMWMCFGWIQEFYDFDRKLEILERREDGTVGKRKKLSVIRNVVRVVL